jgi:hypothetical protein
MNRRHLGALLALAALAACSKPAQEPAKTTLNFSILSAESRPSGRRSWPTWARPPG